MSVPGENAQSIIVAPNSAEVVPASTKTIDTILSASNVVGVFLAQLIHVLPRSKCARPTYLAISGGRKPVPLHRIKIIEIAKTRPGSCHDLCATQARRQARLEFR